MEKLEAEGLRMRYNDPVRISHGTSGGRELQGADGDDAGVNARGNAEVG
jgi:hypothetical protein